MVNEFLNLNKDKLKFGLKWLSIIFTSLVLITFAWGLVYGQIPEWTLFVSVLLCASILFPVFIMTVGSIKEFKTYKRTKEILDNYPFNELTKNGFRISYEFENSKWMFTQLLLRGYFDDFQIVCEVQDSTFKMIALSDNLSEKHIRILKKEFGENKIESEGFGVSLKYDAKREVVTPFDQLNSDLRKFIRLLQRENMDPLDNGETVVPKNVLK